MPVRLTYEFVKQYIESFGYKLISKQYIDQHKKITFQCSFGHIYKAPYERFRRGHRCFICGHNKQKVSYDHVKNLVESIDGYKLLSKNYIQAHKKLEIMCSKKHIYEASYNVILSGRRCHKCNIEKRSLSYDNVKNYIESIGYRLISKEYINAHKKIEIQCPIGHIYSVAYGNFFDGQRCPICWKEQNYSKGEKEILACVQQIYTGTILPNDRHTIWNPKTKCYVELDILIPGLMKAIEYGCKFHHTNNYKDNLKIMECKRLGIDLLVMDDKVWRKTRDYNSIKQFILGGLCPKQ